MNDFTKEELKDMAEAVDWWFKDVECDSPERLYLKLKDMIDNYCEHKLAVYINSDGRYIKCYKCGKEYTGD
jgi:hypothetical protein